MKLWIAGVTGFVLLVPRMSRADFKIHKDDAIYGRSRRPGERVSVVPKRWTD